MLIHLLNQWTFERKFASELTLQNTTHDHMYTGGINNTEMIAQSNEEDQNNTMGNKELTVNEVREVFSFEPFVQMKNELA